MALERKPLRRAIPVVIFSVVLLLGLALAWALHVSGQSQRSAVLTSEVEEIARAVELRMAQNVSVLRAVKALFELEPTRMTPLRFAQFVSKIDLANAYPGMRGVGFAARIPVGSEEEAARRFELPRPIHPETTQAVRAPVSLLEPRDARNEAALGFDMYSEAIRRAAMIEAEAADQPVATAPVVLRQEITPDVQNGFLVYLPTRDAQGGVDGFAYAPFRIGELLSDAGLRRLMDKYVVRVDDVTGGESTPLYAGAHARDRSQETAAELRIAARTWRISVAAARKAAAWSDALRPLGVAALALILASLVAAAYRDQQRAQEIEAALAAERLKTLSEREVLLQEMNHRIKNAIARIAAIARSTARGAVSLDDFQTSFSGRLAAMAAAQDLVTRATDAGASLREVFAAELDQIFPQGDARLSMQGEAVELDGRMTQGLALVVHELATNAAKHGAARDPAGRLAVRWARLGGALTIDWTETCAPAPVEAPRKGFGSRLIAMIVESEMKGRMERDLTPAGLRLRLWIPLGPQSA